MIFMGGIHGTGIVKVSNRFSILSCKLDYHRTEYEYPISNQGKNINFTSRKTSKYEFNGIKNDTCSKKLSTEHKSHIRKLKCFYANARSIMNKKEELELYVDEENQTLSVSQKHGP